MDSAGGHFLKKNDLPCRLPTSYFVDFRDVWFAYNDELRARTSLRSEAIDLQVRRGEFIAIVGPSGCGSPPS